MPDVERSSSPDMPDVERSSSTTMTESLKVPLRHRLMNIPLFKEAIKAVVQDWKDEQMVMYEIPEFEDLPSLITQDINFVEDERYLFDAFDVFDENLCRRIYAVIDEHAPLLS